VSSMQTLIEEVDWMRDCAGVGLDDMEGVDQADMEGVNQAD